MSESDPGAALPSRVQEIIRELKKAEPFNGGTFRLDLPALIAVFEDVDRLTVERDALITAAQRAWPSPRDYSGDPTELVTAIIDERDDLASALQQTQAERDVAEEQVVILREAEAAHQRLETENQQLAGNLGLMQLSLGQSQAAHQRLREALPVVVDEMHRVTVNGLVSLDLVIRWRDTLRALASPESAA